MKAKPTEAYEDFRYVINSDYSDHEAQSEALFFSGLANIQLGNIDEGIKILNEYLEHNETSVDVVYWLGIAYYLLDDIDTAKEHFDSAILEDPGFENAYLARGKVHILSRDLGSAFNDFYKIIELNPKNAEAEDFTRIVVAMLNICQ